MKRVLVLDANQRSALAVTRSLGKQGVPVITAEKSSSALAGSSRFSQQHLKYPSPEQCPDQFIEVLGKLVKQHRIDILLPMTELTTGLLLINKNAFPGTALPFPDIKTVDSLANKYALIQMAEELGVTTPRTWYADDPDSLPVDLDELSYPLVLKPGRSWLLQQGEWQRAAVRFAHNASQARDILNNEPAFRVHPFILQEYVAGHGEGVFALYNHGKQFAFFAHRRLREKPPEGGVSVLSESIAVDPALLSHTRCLLDKAHWHGVAMVEFKVTADGTPYLMEINTRFWGSLQLAVDAGMDFPWLLYQLTSGEQPAPVENYKTAIRLRWMLGDVDNLYLTLRDSRYSFGAKLNALRRFLTPSPFKTRHEVGRWSDPAPAWYELKQYLRDILE
jgi:predicted ATP-grasp superfamily ATP-dependent carboligase